MTDKKLYFEKKYNSIWGKNTLNKLFDKKKELKNTQHIRINTSKVSIDYVENFLKKNRVKYEISKIPNCIEIKKTFFSLSSSPQSLLGEIYLQDYASQLPVLSIPKKYLEKKNIKILDMCASPGSKATQIADIILPSLNPEFTLIEADNKRITKLINNVQKQQMKNTKIHQVKGDEFSTSIKYDIILLDAPCSGNLIDDNNWIDKRDEKGILQRAQLQKKLLKKAYELIDKNGIIVYSTCSMEVEENEMNIDWFLKNYNVDTIQSSFKFPFRTKPLLNYKNQKFSKQILKTHRLMPLDTNTQGFYIALLKKI